jgi:GTP cyclohydrolase I
MDQRVHELSDDVLDETPSPTYANRDLPLSQRIRSRLTDAGKRFHANDNISPYLLEGEIELLQQEVACKMKEVLRSLVIDVEADHNSRDTAQRVAKMFVREVFAGRYEAPPQLTEFPNVEHLNELLIVGPLRVRSACSHHLCPIMGRIWIGVMPNENSNLIGLSKYARLIDWVMRRPQIQEEAITQIADLLEKKLKPDGLAVVLEADHFCMHWRGVEDDQSKMVNTIMRGAFRRDRALRSEFLALLPERR